MASTTPTPATLTSTSQSFGSMIGSFQSKMNKLQEEWSTKVDDSIVKERQTLQDQREILKMKEEELQIREQKLKEDDDKLKRRVDLFDAFVSEEEERLEELQKEYEKKKKVEEEGLENIVMKEKIHFCYLENKLKSLTKSQDDLRRENEELRKKLASKKEKEFQRELHFKLKEVEMEKLEKNLWDEKELLRRMEEDMKMKQAKLEEEMGKLSFLEKGKEVEAKARGNELVQDNAGPPVWLPAEEYVTSLEKDVSSDDTDDQLLMKNALQILNVAAGKGKGKNCQLAFFCSPRMIYEAKLAYRYEPDFKMIEVLAVGKGDSPVDAVWSACKSVQKIILDASANCDSDSSSSSPSFTSD